MTKRFDLLDNALARALGIHVNKEQVTTALATLKRNINDGLDQDKWHDSAFMDDVRQATLQGANPFANLLYYSLLILLVVFFLWASLAPLDETARGQGLVIPSGNIQMVGSPEGGVVQSIEVESGQVVEAGQVLVRLDNSAAAAGVGEKETRQFFLKTVIARLSAELDGTDFVVPPEVATRIPQLATEQTSLFQNRKAQLTSTVGVLMEQAEQRRQELADARRSAGSLAEALKLANDELNMMKPHFSSGAISRADLLRAERQVVEARKEYNTARTAIMSAEAAVREAENKLEEGTLTYKNEAREELAKSQDELARLGQAVGADVGRKERTVLKSPVRAEVKQVMVNTIGQAVQPNTNIVELVPMDETLLVEAQMKPSDIAFIRAGMPAMVKLSAYDFGIYGGLKGKVESVSPDSFTDKENKTFYKIKVRTTQNSIQRFGQKLAIKSGMVATVDVITGKKTVMQYLLKPINKAREEAFSER